MRKKKIKKEKILNHKKYLNDLNEDIIKKKNYVDPVQKKKNDIYLFDQKEKEKNQNKQKFKIKKKFSKLKKYN